MKASKIPSITEFMKAWEKEVSKLIDTQNKKQAFKISNEQILNWLNK